MADVGGIVLGGVIAILGGALAHIWALRERGAERREIRIAARLAQRATDLRELGHIVGEMDVAAREIIWERISSDKLMPRSDPRAMKLTGLAQQSRFLRVAIGDDDLIAKAKAVAGASTRLSDSSRDMMDADINALAEAMMAALDRVAVLLHDAEA